MSILFAVPVGISHPCKKGLSCVWTQVILTCESPLISSPWGSSHGLYSSFSSPWTHVYGSFTLLLSLCIFITILCSLPFHVLRSLQTLSFHTLVVVTCTLTFDSTGSLRVCGTGRWAGESLSNVTLLWFFSSDPLAPPLLSPLLFPSLFSPLFASG